MPTLFASELRGLCLRENLTQTALADRLGIDASRISRVMHGEQPSMHLIELLNKEFAVNAAEWLNEEPEAEAESREQASPRVIHLKDSRRDEQHEKAEWRGQAVDLLSRMTDLLERILGLRGGWVNNCYSAI